MRRTGLQKQIRQHRLVMIGNVDIGERLAGRVVHVIAAGMRLGGPVRREAARHVPCCAARLLGKRRETKALPVLYNHAHPARC